MAESVPIIGIMRHRLMTDGNGVCSLVAFHSCPLDCKFCLNPQSLSHEERAKFFTPSQLYARLKADELYFLATNGGVTFGGGEPALRSSFIVDFRKHCGPDWKLGIETSLNVSDKKLKALVPVIDHYIIDIKDINPQIYKDYTGKDNSQVLQNLHLLSQLKLTDRCVVRIPLIPGYNTVEDQRKSIVWLKEKGFKKFDQFTYLQKAHRT